MIYFKPGHVYRYKIRYIHGQATHVNFAQKMFKYTASDFNARSLACYTKRNVYNYLIFQRYRLEIHVYRRLFDNITLHFLDDSGLVFIGEFQIYQHVAAAMFVHELLEL